MSSFARKQLQLTLAIIKPHVVKAPHALQQIHETILFNGFFIVRTKKTVMAEEEAKKFYEEHKDKFFFNRLVTFMCSGPLVAHILAHAEAISEWRRLMGPTKVYEAQFTDPDSIRGNHGLSDTRNATHGSDSPESFLKEYPFFFPDFDVKKWYKEEEKYFVEGMVQFNMDKFIHEVIPPEEQHRFQPLRKRI